MKNQENMAHGQGRNSQHSRPKDVQIIGIIRQGFQNKYKHITGFSRRAG